MHISVGDAWIADSRWGEQGEQGHLSLNPRPLQNKPISLANGGRDDLGPRTPKYRYALFIGVFEIPVVYNDTSPTHVIVA